MSGSDYDYCRECCGKPIDVGPPAGLENVSGDDPETGPWDDVVCHTHGGQS